jgi:hypothetical protein
MNTNYPTVTVEPYNVMHFTYCKQTRAFVVEMSTLSALGPIDADRINIVKNRPCGIEGMLVGDVLDFWRQADKRDEEGELVAHVYRNNIWQVEVHILND